MQGTARLSRTSFHVGHLEDVVGAAHAPPVISGASSPRARHHLGCVITSGEACLAPLILKVKSPEEWFDHYPDPRSLIRRLWATPRCGQLGLTCHAGWRTVPFPLVVPPCLLAYTFYGHTPFLIKLLSVVLSLGGLQVLRATLNKVPAIFYGRDSSRDCSWDSMIFKGRAMVRRFLSITQCVSPCCNSCLYFTLVV